ncbi:hypothetical protein OGAPHI_001128 [Ogataea philodendri]|uniref:carnosine N-methyltransferase n=1 Tax=Ogataea philodendri TaxID=1378263 RepID=A0A9P8PE57_9ASCO|nr:uncharacterized protein OGAPHI_001128 [Ogataea philodendri]KAH3670613.1 hypothetical protein OGAPHI_001128 [Ogataea philodendri]
MDQEYKALTSVFSAHNGYKSWATKRIVASRRLKYASLTASEKNLLPWMESHIDYLEHSIDLNSQFLQQIATTVAPIWGAESDPGVWAECSGQDLENVRSVLVQFAREWSSDGEQERDISFGRILRECESLFPDVEARQNVEVLVPGAGLGRLVIEFVKRGFRTQGNEFSYHMLTNSSFIINHSFCANNYVICPYVHRSTNVAKRSDQVRQIYVPDYNPGDISLINHDYPNIPVADLMSIVAGSFVDLYGPPNLERVSDVYTTDEQAQEFRVQNKGKFQVVATCFFLDTAANIIEYLQAIHHCLADDGYWINFGPLLWHHEDDETVTMFSRKDDDGEWKQVPTPARGLELSRDDLVDLVKDTGFEFTKHESGIEATYGGDPRSLGGFRYKSEFWVAKKKQV